MSGSTVVVSDHFPSEAVVTVAMGTENEKWVCTKWVVKVIIEAPAPELASSHLVSLSRSIFDSASSLVSELDPCQ